VHLALHSLKARKPTIKPSPHLLTGVGFLQSGGVKAIEIINRSRGKGTPTMKMNREMVE
jgi:hypothetical protein